ncbi:MAG: GntR family transcriptional regulator [Chitinivibrionales bacterium]|nr:GntR family transcriptional regulator [Chitinivibrionales bacterium]
MPDLTPLLEYLRARVVRVASAGERRLPSVSSLAREAGVAPVTMLKALAVLKEEGTVSAHPGRGIFILDNGPMSHLSPKDRPSLRIWENARDALSRDIALGVYTTNDALPQPKELCETYGVCYRTLRKVLADLSERGTLTRHKRMCRVSGHQPGRRPDTVILVAAGTIGGDLRRTSSRTVDSLHALETECGKLNVSLRIQAVTGERGIPVSTLDEGQRAVLGCVVWAAGLSEPFLQDLMSRLAGRTWRASVLLESDNFPVPVPDKGARRVALFSSGRSPDAGRRVGTYLAHLGHRDIAYISPVHGSMWSQNRLQGLREAFVDGKRGDSVHEFVLRQFSRSEEIIVRAYQVQQSIQGLLASGLDSKEADPVLRRSVLSLQRRLSHVMRRETLRERRSLCSRRLSPIAVSPPGWYQTTWPLSVL